MKQIPIEIALLNQLTVLGNLSAFWLFTQFFDHEQVNIIVFENEEQMKDKSVYFFSIGGGSVDHIPIKDNKENEIGMFHTNNGCLFHFQINGINFPLELWSEEYLTLYNSVHGTSYLRMK